MLVYYCLKIQEANFLEAFVKAVAASRFDERLLVLRKRRDLGCRVAFEVFVEPLHDLITNIAFVVAEASGEPFWYVKQLVN